ncbi:HDOD domain-containing protein [Marinobacterium sp. AK62]|uniref:HDOD domain-containing protein n=1 Tax=Marinobacterium alkalitolerans TaxID=1542925 RepID=A0ABS3ZBX9_9GAMM|nr:HDOD domain-containing protein [Marinobacterium alkalitolerans]MBP0048778.1 HDOD domain-containing protein [Marinobacterium alkalitolerans]
MKYQQTLNSIYSRLDRLGDLPVFSATVNRIRQVSSSRQSDAMALAMAVMKDANLSTKLLKIANTPTYNRSGGHISAVSRAVVLIGFERIQNLCVTLKLIESFRDEQPDSLIEPLLIRAFLNASMAREMAAAANIRDIEETYICGLLYGLGEIIVAFTLPDTYRDMLRQRVAARESWGRIQLQALGGNFSDIGQDLAQGWGFPKSVVQAMDPMTADQLTGGRKANYSLASGCHDLLELIYQRDTADELDYDKLMNGLADVTGQQPEQLEAHMDESFRQLCDLAEEYGLAHSVISPKMTESENESLNDLTRRLAYYVHSREHRQRDTQPAAEPASPSVDRQSLWMEQQLQYLQKLNDLIAQQASASQLIEVAVKAVVDCCGLERSAFCLLGGLGRELKVRFAAGYDCTTLEHFFQLRQGDADSTLFFRILSKRMTLLVPDANEPGWRERLPDRFLDQVQPQGFIMAPLVVKERLIGLLYADKLSTGSTVEDEEFRVFNQFLVQLRLGLEVMQGRR